MRIIYVARKHIGICLIIAFCFWAVKPLLLTGFFPIHDDTQVARIFEMSKSLKDGMFPVRWVSDLGYGYGYPLFNFYAPLAYYFGGLITILGITALASTKIVFAFGIISAGIFMYMLARQFWGNPAGLIAALFYTFAPYHAIDLYVRGDLAELFAYAFIPLAFYGFWKVYMTKKWSFVAIAAFGYAAIILSHNLTAMMATPFLVSFCLLLIYIKKEKKKSLVFLLALSIFVSLLISSFYWLPALLEMQYTNVLSQVGGGADYRNHFVCIEQLWSSQWGFGGSIPGCIDGLSFMAGKLHIILSLLAGMFLIIFLLMKLLTGEVFHYNNTYHYSGIRHWKTSIHIFYFVCFIISIIFTLEISKPIWEVISPMAFLQYPWRFLIFVSFFSSLLAASFVDQLKVFTSMRIFGYGLFYGIVSAIVILAFILYAKFFVPQRILHVSLGDYTNEMELKWRVSKISDEYMPKSFAKPNSPQDVTTQKILDKDQLVTISLLAQKTQYTYAIVDILQPTTLLIKTAYFPSWEISVDGVKQQYAITNQGLLLPVSKGQHVIDVAFVQTPIEKAANVVSLIGVSVLIVGIMRSRKIYYG